MRRWRTPPGNDRRDHDQRRQRGQQQHRPSPADQRAQPPLEVTGGVSSTDNSGLNLILEDIRDNWDETKAGSTRQAVELLDWAVGSSASEERIRVTVTDWMEPMGNDAQNDFAVGLARVKRFCELRVSRL